MLGHTILGNDIKIEAQKDYETGSFGKYWHYTEITIEMNGNEMNIDDLSDRNKEWIINQLPPL